MSVNEPGRPLDATPLALPHPAAPASRRVFASAALILLAAILAYSGSFQGPFIYDDNDAIVDNPTIRRLASTEVLLPPRDTPVAGRPVANLAFAVSCAVSGFDVAGYHVFNLMLHLLTALLLFGVAGRTLASERLPANVRRSAPQLGLAVALIWAVHPLLTESVVYLTQRTELLMGFFCLLTLYAAIRASESDRPWRWQAVAVAACALGMGSKESMAAVPLLALMHDRAFSAGTFREAFRLRWRFYVALFLTWLILLALAATSPRSLSAGFDRSVSVWQYMLTQTRAITHYVCLSVWPSPLVIHYDWKVATSLSQVWVFAVAVVSLLALAAWSQWRYPAAGFLGAWFFLILAPSSSVVPITTELVAERRMYLPLAAVITGAVLLAWTVLQRTAPGCAAASTAWRRLPAALTLLCAGALACGTMARVTDYRSVVGIWEDVVRKSPASSKAYVSLGAALTRAGKPAEAMCCFQEALRLNPDSPYAAFGIGTLLAGQGRLEDGAVYLRRAVEIKPGFAVAHNNLASVLRRLRRYPEAVGHFEQALALKPHWPEVQRNLAGTLAGMRRWSEAVAHYRESLRLRPDAVETMDELAWLLATCPDDATRNGPEAVRLAERSRFLAGGERTASLRTLAAAYAEAGRYSEAVQVAGEAAARARASGDAALAADVDALLGALRQGRPWRTP